ncbi:MAG: thioesterase family protein [Solirubrobacteraceae bacterium]
MNTGETPVFRSDGDRYVPTPHARGPWDPHALHGGAPAALLAGAVEAFEPQQALRVARLSYEFLRPVPLAPLELRLAILRPGRRVQLIGAALHDADGAEVCRLTALRLARAPAVLDGPGPAPRPGSAPKELSSTPFALGTPPRKSFATSTMEMRFAAGGAAPGPADVWMRLRRPLLDGREPTPLMRIAAAADFGNGVAAELDFARTVFINPDLTIHIAREPAGEWVLLRARTLIERGEGSIALALLHDERGQLGVAAQSLLVENR